MQTTDVCSTTTTVYFSSTVHTYNCLRSSRGTAVPSQIDWRWPGKKRMTEQHPETKNNTNATTWTPKEMATRGSRLKEELTSEDQIMAKLRRYSGAENLHYTKFSSLGLWQSLLCSCTLMEQTTSNHTQRTSFQFFSLYTKQNLHKYFLATFKLL